MQRIRFHRAFTKNNNSLALILVLFPIILVPNTRSIGQLRRVTSQSRGLLPVALVDHFRRVRSHFRAHQNTTRFQPSISPWFTPSVLNVSPFLRLSPHSLIVKSVLRAFTSRSKSLGLLRQKEFRSLALGFALTLTLSLSLSLFLSLSPFTD